MRIKIKGEVTAERLAEALQMAMERYADARPSVRIFGATLYLTAFDAEGAPFELADAKGNLLSLDLSAEASTLVKPGLTAEGEARLRQAKERRAQQAAEDDAHRQLLQEEVDREQLADDEKAAEARRLFSWLTELTDNCLRDNPDHFVSELNAAVSGVWETMKPTEPHGPRKGEPKPCPHFQYQAGQFFLASDVWVKPKKIKTPVGVLSYNSIEPFWRNEAWGAATTAIFGVLERLNFGDASGEIQA